MSLKECVVCGVEFPTVQEQRNHYDKCKSENTLEVEEDEIDGLIYNTNSY